MGGLRTFHLSKRVNLLLEQMKEQTKQFQEELKYPLILTNPSFFEPETVEKVKALRNMRNDLDIEVDGGITDKTINLVNDAGANLFVSGSFIVKSDNVKKAV